MVSINLGNSVKTAIIATIIARPVKIPNIIVGMKLESTSIENPKIMVTLVKKIALPILLCDALRASS